MMSNLSEMHFFVVVVDSGSISEAANRIGTAKSVVSRRLQQLEKRLGVTLIERGRRMYLTQPGTIFYEYCVQIIADIREAEEAVQSFATNLNGRLRLAVPMSFGHRYLTPVLADFSQRYPELNMDIQYEDRIVNLHEEGFDVAIRIGELPDSSLISRTITTNRHVICASPGYLAEYGEPLVPQDLEHHQALLYTHREPHGMWSLPVKDTLESFRVQSRLRTNDAYQLMESAIAGMGLAILPAFLAVDAILTGALQIIMPNFSPHGGEIAIVYRQSMRASPKIEVLSHFLREHFGNPPEWEEKLRAHIHNL